MFSRPLLLFAAKARSAAINLVVFLGSALVGLFGAVIGYVIFSTPQEKEMYYFVGIISFCIGTIIISLTTEVIDSGVATLFVCFVENPNRLQETHPEVYQKFQEKYASVCDLFERI